MTKTVRAWAPWLLVGIYFIFSSIGPYLHYLAGTTFADMGIPNGVVAIFYYFLGLIVIIGALIAVRQPENPVGWILSIGLTTPAIDILASGLTFYLGTAALGVFPALAFTTTWLNWSGMPFGIGAFALVFFLTPDGKFLSNRWRYLAWITVAALTSYLGIKIVEPGPLVIMPAVDNPFGANPAVWRTVGPLMWFSLALLIACYLGSIGSLFVRYRQSGENARRKVRWLIPAALIFALGIPLILLGEHGPRREFFDLGGAVQMLGVVGVVASVAFAVLKYQLYDLEIILNRTLVYGTLTTALAIVYFASVALLQRVFPSQSQAAVVISTFAIAALFSPLRRRIQAAIDRRFFRRRYDAAQIMTCFSGTVRNQVDLEALTRTLLELVEATIEPQSASLWLKSSEKPK